MKFSIKPKSFQADVRSLLDSAAKKGFFFYGIIFNDENVAIFSPDQNSEWQAKLTAFLILNLVNANGSDLDTFIDKILAEVAKIRED